MKKKKHKFLKRGEGLKRFEIGNLKKSKENAEKIKAEKLKKQQQKEKKGVQFTIDAPPKLLTQQNAKNSAKTQKSRPGLPLKLKLRRSKDPPKSTAVATSSGKTLGKPGKLQDSPPSYSPSSTPDPFSQQQQQQQQNLNNEVSNQR